MDMMRISPARLRWAVTACLLAAAAVAGLLVAMSNSPPTGTAPASAVSPVGHG